MNMKAEDLIIGDWVNVFDSPKQIEGIRKFRNGDEIVYYDGDNGNFIKSVTPIPLTPEILEKNGFNKLTEPPYITYYELGLNEYMNKVLWYKGSIVIGYEGDNVYLCDCEYVHELQHALKDNGIEKEIVL